jgi:DnaK suppressor protein
MAQVAPADAHQNDRMDTYEKAMAQRFRAVLLERANQLAGAMSSPAVAQGADPTADVSDFKDAADREALAELDDARSALAAEELDDVRQALRRIEDGTYGICMDCGDTIVERRLLAMPAARYCASCEATRERNAT